MNKTLSSAFHRSAIRSSKALLLSAAGPVALVCAAPALADEGAAAPLAATATAETPVGEPILVTARRRDENVQKVPIAISVIGSEALAKTGNYTLSQVQQLVPSLQVYSFNPRNTNINIRGLGANVSLTNDGLENGVGFYLDNVYYGRPGQSQFDLVDLQQIEVLRGPQGTLFGKNTTAGAINITSKAPSFRPEAYGEASGGNYGYYQFRASVSAPIIADKAAFRLSLSDTHRDGYLTNIHDGSKAQDYDNVAIRGQLLIKPADAVSVKLIGDYANQRQNYVLNVPVAYVTNYDSGAVLANNIVQRAARANYTLLPASPFARFGDSDSHYQAKMRSYGVSGQVDWDLGGPALTSITAYRWWDWDPANDGDSTGLPVTTKAQQANRQRQFSQEIRLASQGKHTIDWVVGAYYFWQTIRGYGASAYGSAAANWNLPAANQAVAAAALNGFEANSFSDPITRSYALFGQANWNISERLSFTGGLRYTHEDKSGVYRQWWAAGTDLSTLSAADAQTATAYRNAFNPQTSYSIGLSDDSVSGLATLSWKAARDVLIYGSYSRGSKSGGLNLTNIPAGFTTSALTVRPETVDNVEVGVKSQWFDRHLTANLAGFWTNVKDYQTAISAYNALGSLVQYISNIPKVRSRGIEGDLTYTPSRWVTLTASGSYVEALYRDYANAPQALENNPAAIAAGGSGPTQNLSGVQLPGVPRFSYSLGADVAQPLKGGSLVVYGHADFAHKSSFNTSSNNSRYAQVPGYGLLNARLGIRSESDRWDLSVWARNLTNTNYFQALSAAATGYITGTIGDPRTYGVTVKTKW